MTADAVSADDLRRFCGALVRDPSDHDRTMIQEAAFGLTRLAPWISRGGGAPPRLLEIGAGSLILSAYLACRGFDVTAVEPTGEEFAEFVRLQRIMLDAAARERATLIVWPHGVEDVSAREAFDVVFSVNAVEHMPDPYTAVDIMHRAVRPGGVVFVHCPNYDVPFDSHFGIALIGWSKPLNERVYRRRIADKRAMWDGLTFVRLSALRRHCARRGYAVGFNRAMLRNAVLRLREDPIFSARMPRPLRAVGRLLARRWVADALTLVPVRFQTPMEFVIRKP